MSETVNNVRIKNQKLDCMSAVDESALLSAVEHAIASPNADPVVILKAAKTALASIPEDQDLLNVVAVANIHLAKFGEALEAAESARNPELKAYCLYRLRRDDEAIAMMSPGFLGGHLVPQLSYRANDFKSAFESYKSMDSDDLQIRSNMVACAVGASEPVPVRDIEAVGEDTDHSYNVACALLSQGKAEESVKILRDILVVLQEAAVEEGLSQTEAALESLDATVLLGCALSAAGDVDESTALFTASLSIPGAKDCSAIATAANNAVAARSTGDHKLFEVRKRLMRASRVPGFSLTTQQSRVLAINQCILAVYEKNNERAIKEVSELIDSSNGDDMEVLLLIKASALHAIGRMDECFTLLRGSDSLGTTLALAHLELLSGNHESAMQILSSLPEHQRYLPGVVATLLEMTRVFKVNSRSTVEVLSGAIAYWKPVDEAKANLLFAKGIDFKFANGLYEEAFADLESAGSLSDIPSGLLAKYVLAASSAGRSDLVEKFVPLLPPLPGIDEIDVAKLEANISVPLDIVRRREERKKKDETVAGETEERVRVKKKKKIRYPKNFDPENPGPMPDAERWLPKWQRSQFRKCRWDFIFPVANVVCRS